MESNLHNKPLALYSYEDVLSLLETRFPLTKPAEDDTLSQIQRKAGHRDVVDFLHSLLEG